MIDIKYNQVHVYVWSNNIPREVSRHYYMLNIDEGKFLRQIVNHISNRVLWNNF